MEHPTGRADQGGMNMDSISKQFMEDILKRGYDEKFVRIYRSEFNRQKILDKYRAGDPTVWDDVEALHDEYCYFRAGFDAVVIEA